MRDYFQSQYRKNACKCASSIIVICIFYSLATVVLTWTQNRDTKIPINEKHIESNHQYGPSNHDGWRDSIQSSEITGNMNGKGPLPQHKPPSPSIQHKVIGPLRKSCLILMVTSTLFQISATYLHIGASKGSTERNHCLKVTYSYFTGYHDNQSES